MATPAKNDATTGTQAPAPAASFPPFDQSTFVPQLIWLALTFGFLYVALSRFLLPRITDVIDARQDGIARDRLVPAGVGPLAPVATNATEEGRAKNRRVELVVRP